jgi:hypothetical protein
MMGAATLLDDGGATCTSAIKAACTPIEIHAAASGRRRCAGIDGSSSAALLTGARSVRRIDALPGTFGRRRKAASRA